MRKLIATIAAAIALAGVGLASHTATSDGAHTSVAADRNSYILPYIEQEILYRHVSL